MLNVENQLNIVVIYECFIERTIDTNHIKKILLTKSFSKLNRLKITFEWTLWQDRIHDSLEMLFKVNIKRQSILF